MSDISRDLIDKLKKRKVDTFFGVQGGACARLIEDVIKSGGRYYPVLNEQAAGYAAHGYYLATKKTAGLILTTGPGFTNAISGIAACYYDNIPLIVLVGQVPQSLKKASQFKTKMVGFQEIPHLRLGQNIADKVFCINSENNYKKFIKNDLNTIVEKVSIIEVLDDVQRFKIKKEITISKSKKIKSKKIKFIKKTFIKLNKQNNLLFTLGAGFSRSKQLKINLKLLNKLKIPSVVTWGAQEIVKKIKLNYGIFGEQSPGVGNKHIEESELIICLGASLLQHQAGKIKKNFAPKAKIFFVNNNLNECMRAKKQFGKRLTYFHCEIDNFLNSFLREYKIRNLPKTKVRTKNILSTKIDKTPVAIISHIFNEIDKKSSIIFSDAGATLSWSYQAANILGKKCSPIYTSFNLHAMGYANCAGFGAVTTSKKNIFVVIGDGSVPMNSQELAWANKFKIKFIVIDNKGYGIIRQTQKQFYKSFFIGSDFRNKKSSLPNFSVEKIFKSYNISTIKTNSSKINLKKLKNFLNAKKSTALLIKTEYSAEVKLK